MISPRCLLALSIVGAATPRPAAGDFPLASCKMWNGTVAAISGVDSAKASMSGTVTKADVREFCLRDPGGETIRYGGKLTVTACVDRYFRQVDGVKVVAVADCGNASLELRNGDDVQRVHFPVDDVSCASGTPPLIAQFIRLCPARARQLRMPAQ